MSAEELADAIAMALDTKGHHGVLPYAALLLELREAGSDAELFMSALVEMFKADMREDYEHGMARFNSSGFVEAIRYLRAVLAKADEVLGG